MSLLRRLYRGEIHYDFIGHRRRWYTLSAIVVLISLASLLIRGFQLGIDFKGGASFEVPARSASVSTARAAVAGTGAQVESAQSLAGSGRIRIQTRPLDEPQLKQVSKALQTKLGIPASAVSVSTVGASWGASITSKALQGLVAFLVLVVVYISIRYEPKMAAAAIVALLHDLLITAGIYSLVGFEVTPSTVIALLTILGFSLYDTVVVFDKIRENTAGVVAAGRRSYTAAVNDAVDQTLSRSINTSLIALLPVAALLFIGAGLLGAGTLKDLALAQFIGLASGAYSSIFIAAPLLVDFKLREPKIKALEARVSRSQQAAATRPTASTELGGARLPEQGGAGVALLDRPAGEVGEDEEEHELGSPAAVPAQPRSGQPAQLARPTGATRRPARRSKPGRPSGKKRR